MRVDAHLRTSAPHIFAAGDVTGRLMLVPQALQDGFVAATNAVRGADDDASTDAVSPIGSFTDPEYAQVGPDRGAGARRAHDVVVATVRFDATTRTIIDGRTIGFCKLIVDRATRNGPRLPRRRRAGGRHRADGRDRHGRGDARRRPRARSPLVPDLHGHPRPRGGGAMRQLRGDVGDRRYAELL